MANEHVLMTQNAIGIPVTYLCSDATGIEKGTVLMWAAGGNTVAAAANTAGTAVYPRVAGVAYTEKRASDGNAVVAVINGFGNEFKAVASGSISRGDPVGVSVGVAGQNKLVSLSGAAALSGAIVLGYSAEDCTVGQTFKYVMNLQSLSF